MVNIVGLWVRLGNLLEEVALPVTSMGDDENGLDRSAVRTLFDEPRLFVNQRI
jgi:hypothetical protein